MTPEATGGTLARSVAANLSFKMIDPKSGSAFDARRGKTLLKVVEGIATTEIVDTLVSYLNPDETVVIAAMSVMDGVREYLRRVRKGSRIIVLPDDIFQYSKGDEEQ